MADNPYAGIADADASPSSNDYSSVADPDTVPATTASTTPSAGMSNDDLTSAFKSRVGRAPEGQGELDAFKSNPENFADRTGAQPVTLSGAASRLSGVPRVIATYGLAVPAAVAGAAGYGSGALAAAMTGDTDQLAAGRERGRAWTQDTYGLANHIPATAAGAAAADTINALPGEIIKDTVGAGLKAALPDNAYQTVADIGQDVGNLAPLAGVVPFVRGVGKAGAAAARGTGAAASAVADAIRNPVAPEGTTYDAAGTAIPPAPAPRPLPVGRPVTGSDLRAKPNPIPSPVAPPAAHAAAAATAEPPPPPPARPPVETTPEATQMPSGIGAAQGGGARIFNEPKSEGPKETPTPEQQGERAKTLDDLDSLSGGAMPARRASALSGDYNGTGNDWQLKETGSAPMQAQVASENAAMHQAMSNVHDSIGSEFKDGVDNDTLSDRGRVTRGAIHAIEDHFNGMTDSIYEAARATRGNDPMPPLSRVTSYLKDEANYMPDGFRRAAQARLQQLWQHGDTENNAAPGSVGASEVFRQWLNKSRTLDNMNAVRDLKGHVDLDVAEHGGPGLFQAARAMRQHQAQMLEEPAGIKKLLQPGDSQGINHAIPEHKVMDYIADLPREQHEHVLKVLQAGAHLGDGSLAEQSASAIREIQAHVASRMHAAATDDGGKWNARGFYTAANRYSRNMPALMRDRPDVTRNLQTINSAGNVLHMDKHYPGAAAQTARTGVAGHALEAAGGVVASVAHEIPLGGRMIGKAIERGVEKVSGKATQARLDAAGESRIIRNPKERGSVRVMPEPEDFDKAEHVTLATPHEHFVDENGDHNFTTAGGKSWLKAEPREDGGLRVRASYTDPAEQRQGNGGVLYQKAAEHATANGGKFESDSIVSNDAARRWDELRRNGWDVQRDPNTQPTAKGLINEGDKPVFSTAGRKPGAVFSKRQAPAGDYMPPGRYIYGGKQAGAVGDLRGTGSPYDNAEPRKDVWGPERVLGNRMPTKETRTNNPYDSGGGKTLGSTVFGGKQRGSVSVLRQPELPAGEGGEGPSERPMINIGLHQGDPANGGRVIPREEALKALQDSGVDVHRANVVQSNSEPTMVASMDRNLTEKETHDLAGKLGQDAIAQRNPDGSGSLYGPKAKEWGGAYNSDYFRMHNGDTATEHSTKMGESAAGFNPEELEKSAPKQTVANAVRNAFPGIYDDPHDIISRLQIAKEDPILHQLFGTTRAELSKIALGREGNLPGTLPGAAAKPKGSKAATSVMTPENETRLANVLNAAKEYPALHDGMTGWYVMDHLYSKVKELLGEKAAPAAYSRLNTLMGMASPGSDVKTEINRGTAAHMMASKGEFDKFLKHAGKAAGDRGKGFPPELSDVMGHPYHRTAQGMPMKNYLDSGEVQMQSPKVPMYIQASGTPETGFQTRTPVGDAHWSRGVGLSDVRTSQSFGSSVSNPEMSALKDWYREKVAARAGLPAVSAQALQWGALGGETGVETAVGAPKLELFAQQVKKAADRKGVKPEVMLERIIKGIAHAG